MKSMLWGAVLAAIVMTGCGGGTTQTTKGGSSQAVVDPSGNWTMTATDAQGNKLGLAALFNQVGATVTANSFTPDPVNSSPAVASDFACLPFSAALSNGTVQNVDQFSGQVAVSNRNTGAAFGTFTFSATLTQDGKSFTGTYSGMPACSAVAASGTFAGAEVPSTSGTWSGTIQPCTWDGQTGTCALFGTNSSFAAVLSQNDETGNVTGNYQVTNLAGFSTGTVAIIPPSDILSGLLWQFTMSDANGSKFVANGTLGLERSFHGHLCGPCSTDTTGRYYALALTH
jgi:hypothetical protein